MHLYYRCLLKNFRKMRYSFFMLPGNIHKFGVSDKMAEIEN